MEEDALTLVANATATTAREIRADLADCLRRLDLVKLSIPAAYLSLAIERLDDDIHRLAAAGLPGLG